MKTIILASTLVLTIATVLPVWGEDTQHRKTKEPSTIEIFQEKIVNSIITIKESRLQMAAESNKSHQKNLMIEHLQEMKNGLEMFEIEAGSNSVGHQYDRRIIVMRGQVEMMMELIRGIMSQQEMIMISGN